MDQEHGKGTGHGVLDRVHVGSDAGEDFARAGLGEEAQRELLDVLVQNLPQVQHHALAHQLVQIASHHAQQRGGQVDREDRHEQQVDASGVPLAPQHGLVHDPLDHEPGQEIECRCRSDQQDNGDQVAPKGLKESQGAQEDGPGCPGRFLENGPWLHASTAHHTASARPSQSRGRLSLPCGDSYEA